MHVNKYLCQVVVIRWKNISPCFISFTLEKIKFSELQLPRSLRLGHCAIWDEIIRMEKTTWVVDTEQKLKKNLLFFKFLSLVMAICTYFQSECSAFGMVKVKMLQKCLIFFIIIWFRSFSHILIPWFRPTLQNLLKPYQMHKTLFECMCRMS